MGGLEDLADMLENIRSSTDRIEEELNRRRQSDVDPEKIYKAISARSSQNVDAATTQFRTETHNSLSGLRGAVQEVSGAADNATSLTARLNAVLDTTEDRRRLKRLSINLGAVALIIALIEGAAGYWLLEGPKTDCEDFPGSFVSTVDGIGNVCAIPLQESPL